MSWPPACVQSSWNSTHMQGFLLAKFLCKVLKTQKVWLGEGRGLGNAQENRNYRVWQMQLCGRRKKISSLAVHYDILSLKIAIKLTYDTGARTKMAIFHTLDF